MNRVDSNKKIFKTQSKLRIYNYQDYLTSTSEGIKKVFDNTRKGIVRYLPNIKLINYQEISIQFYQTTIKTIKIF